jgi:hypothetical protein
MKNEEGYVLRAGIAQGIMPGSTFSIHADNVLDPGNLSLGTFVATPYIRKSSQSLCELNHGVFRSISVPQPAYGRLIYPQTDPTFKVLFSDLFDQQFQNDFSQILETQQGQVRVQSRDQADVELGIDSRTGQVTFKISDPLSNTLGLEVLPYTILPNKESIKHMLFSMAQWKWHASRVPDTRSFMERVELEFYRLSNPLDPASQKLEPVSANLNEGGVASIAVSPNDLYGFKVINNSIRPLYAYLFYMSTINQSIRKQPTLVSSILCLIKPLAGPLFLKAFGSDCVDPPLGIGSYLTLGFGTDDLFPLNFHLGPNTTLDIGVFRLFVTTSPADFESVSQPSPFATINRFDPNDDELVDGVSIMWGGTTGNMGNDMTTPTSAIADATPVLGISKMPNASEAESAQPTHINLPPTDNIVSTTKSVDLERPSSPVHDIKVMSQTPGPQSPGTNDGNWVGVLVHAPPVYQSVDQSEVRKQMKLFEVWDVIEMKLVLRLPDS